MAAIRKRVPRIGQLMGERIAKRIAKGIHEGVGKRVGNSAPLRRTVAVRGFLELQLILGNVNTIAVRQAPGLALAQFLAIDDQWIRGAQAGNGGGGAGNFDTGLLA
jgi:hypothetical protein